MSLNALDLESMRNSISTLPIEDKKMALGAYVVVQLHVLKQAQQAGTYASIPLYHSHKLSNLCQDYNLPFTPSLAARSNWQAMVMLARGGGRRAIWCLMRPRPTPPTQLI